MATLEELEKKIEELEGKLRELKVENELQWEVNKKAQDEIKSLQNKQHEEVVKKQDANIFLQKITGSGIIGAVILFLTTFKKYQKKLKEVINKIKEVSTQEEESKAP